MIAWAPVARGFLLGIGAAAPIGPVNVEIARRTLGVGWRAGFLIGCGAVSVDCFYLILSGLSAHRLLEFRPVSITLGLCGGIFLAYLGTISVMAGLRGRTPRTDTDPPAQETRKSRGSAIRHYATGLLMTLLNPLTLAFWFLSVPAVARGNSNDVPSVCAGVFLATMSWVCFFSTLIYLIARKRQNTALAGANLFGGATLLYYAVRSIWRVVGQLL